jgi:hypothetical protein
VLLYGAAGIHITLAFVALYEHRTLRMPPMEAVRIIVRDSNPADSHAVTTRLPSKRMALARLWPRRLDAGIQSRRSTDGVVGPGWLLVAWDQFCIRPTGLDSVCLVRSAPRCCCPPRDLGFLEMLKRSRYLTRPCVVQCQCLEILERQTQGDADKRGRSPVLRPSGGAVARMVRRTIESFGSWSRSLIQAHRARAA